MGATISEHFKFKSYGNCSNGEELYSLAMQDEYGKWHSLPCSLTTSMLQELADLIKSELSEDASA